MDGTPEPRYSIVPRRLGIDFSRTSVGLCKNAGCRNKRRDGSAYCQQCSDFKRKGATQILVPNGKTNDIVELT